MMPAMTSSPAEPREREFTRIGVIGLGTMGAGIAEVFARNGYDVTGVEITDEALDRGREHLQHSTGRAVARGKLTEAEQAELLGRITFTTSMKDLADADFVVEAVVESIEIKKAVFRELDDIVAPDAILATNTSSLSVTEISTANHSPGRVVGVHFFNPAPVQRLVEVIRTVVTEPEVLADVERLLASVGKSPVVCGDRAGFIANTLAVRLPQPRGLDVRGPLRHPRGHRRGHALRLRLPDGPARAARPDRSRHGVRDPRHDVQAGPRPPARAGPDPQADGHRRVCSAGSPAAASTPTRSPTAPRSCPTT